MLHSAHYAMRQQSSRGQNVVIGGFMFDVLYSIFSLLICLVIYHFFAVKPTINRLKDENEKLKRKLKKYE